MENQLDHLKRADQVLESDHIFKRMTLKVNWARLMFRDLMKTLDKLDLNLSSLSIQFSQSQRVKLHLKQEARNQAFSLLYLSKRLHNGRLRISKMHQLRFLKSHKIVMLKRVQQKNNLLILIKLKSWLLLFPRLSQLPVRLVKCQARLTFHNFRNNSMMKRKLERI